jgi:hypothetical protein
MEPSTGKSFQAAIRRPNSFAFSFPSPSQWDICRKLFFRLKVTGKRGKAAESQNALQYDNENSFSLNWPPLDGM